MTAPDRSNLRDWLRGCRPEPGSPTPTTERLHVGGVGVEVKVVLVGHGGLLSLACYTLWTKRYQYGYEAKQCVSYTLVSLEVA